VTGLAAARRVADAVLYEGYLLYPYRSTAAKNQLRWQFGMLSPEGAAAAGVGERSALAASVLMRPGGTPRVHVRFLQVQWRSVESLVGSRYVPVERLRVGDTEWVPWHEAVEREVVRTGSGPVAAPAGTDVEPLSDPDGRPVGRLVRTRWPVRAELTVASSEVDGYRRLELGLRNTARWDPAESSRDLAARRDPDVPWWDPAADASVSPETDTVLVGDTPVRKGSRVLLRPGRRADAQDMFLAGQVAVVTAVVSDVDGATHVAVVLADDPAADLHDWYGRYWYFAPDELEPVP